MVEVECTTKEEGSGEVGGKEEEKGLEEALEGI